MVGGKVYYVTTPIYYVNDVPHIGHAYTTVAADAIARWHRLKGERVFFLTGTDEHGQKVARAAAAHGRDPQSWCDEMVGRWKEVWERLDISYDDFIRTTEERHTRPVQEFVRLLYERGEIYLGQYEGLYCVACEAFYLPSELVDGRCPTHGTEPELVREENYFFRLSKYAEPLLEHIERNPEFVLPEARRNEVLAFVKGGLEDLSISRTTFTWGIPIPWDPRHVLYVWIDALQNYITAAGYGSDPARFEATWPADIHLVGKDILRFHAVIWPAMLMAAGLGLPRTVFAHGWLLVGGEKMSKTRLTGISPHQLLQTFGPDSYRYYFLREISFGSDGSFSWEAMVARHNSELANEFGNLVQRVTTMASRYAEGKVPTPAVEGVGDGELRDVAREATSAYASLMDSLAFSEALGSLWTLVRQANRYIDENAPWSLAREGGRERLATVLYNALEAVRIVAYLLSPVCPRASREALIRVGAGGELPPYPHGAVWGLLPPGSPVGVGPPLFPRVEE